MFRFAFILLITASLLVCPLRCQLHAEAAAFDQPANTIASLCKCCHPESQAPQNSRSEQCPDSGCDCGDCICQGAVLEHNDSLDVPAPAFLAALPAAVQPRLTDVPATLRQQLCRELPYAGRYLNGRAARLAQHSLLI